MPTCPKCFLAFHRGADSSCPSCGFSLDFVCKKYGQGKVPFRRVTDSAGALRHQDRIRLEQDLEKYERRILPATLAVYFPNILEPFSLMHHSFWLFNHLEIQQGGFGARGEGSGVDPQWLLVLVIDVRTGTACFIWGYQLDPYIHIEQISSSIVKSRLLLRDGKLVEGIRKVMKFAVRHIVSNSGPVLRSPKRFGITFKDDVERNHGKKDMPSSLTQGDPQARKEEVKRKWKE